MTERTPEQISRVVDGINKILPEPSRVLEEVRGDVKRLVSGVAHDQRMIACNYPTSLGERGLAAEASVRGRLSALGSIWRVLFPGEIMEEFIAEDHTRAYRAEEIRIR